MLGFLVAVTAIMIVGVILVSFLPTTIGTIFAIFIMSFIAVGTAVVALVGIVREEGW